MPPFDDVGVPPTVIATYCLAADGVDRSGRTAIGWLVWNVQRTRPLRRSNARTTPSPPPAKPRPLAVVVTPPRSGSRRLELPDAPAGGDVDRADRAVVLPARVDRAEVAVLEPEEDVAEHELAAASASGVSFCCVRTAAVSAAALTMIVPAGVVRRGRVVEAAERGREDDDRLARPERRVLGPVDHLDALVDRRAGPRVVGEPDALHRRDRDDAALLAADAARCRRAAAAPCRSPLVAARSAAATTSAGRCGGRRAMSEFVRGLRPGRSCGQ